MFPNIYLGHLQQKRSRYLKAYTSHFQWSFTLIWAAGQKLANKSLGNTRRTKTSKDNIFIGKTIVVVQGSDFWEREALAAAQVYSPYPISFFRVPNFLGKLSVQFASQNT